MAGGFRVHEIHEEVGLDIAQLGVTIVAMPKNKIEKLIEKCNSIAKESKLDGDADLDAMNHGGDDPGGDSILM